MENRVKIAVMHLDGKAVQWHQGYVRVKGTEAYGRWDEYVQELKARFGIQNKEMGEVKLEECCLENKQLTAASCSSISEGSVSTILKSPGENHRPIRRAKGGWTLEEDETLRNAVAAFKGKSWKKIEVQCLHRWQKVLNPDLVKGPWTQEEDDKIIDLVAKYGPTKWSVIAKSLPGRIGKQCRERWHNHLNPDIKNGAWTLEEELALMNAHLIHGNKWAEIAKVLSGSSSSFGIGQLGGSNVILLLRLSLQKVIGPNDPLQGRRTDNSIKNHWNSSLKKKLDFYLATGKLPAVVKSDIVFSSRKLPSVAKTGIRSGSEDTNKPAVTKMSEDSDSTAQTLSGTTDACKLEENGKDELESLALVRDMAASSSVFPNESTDSEGVECKQHSFVTYHSCCDSNRYENFQTSTYGSLHYEPPRLETFTPIDMDPLVMHQVQHEYSSSPISSPVSSFTPPCVKSSCLSTQSPESILRIAAKSYQNTPSIFRKRKTGSQVHLLPSKIGKVGQESVQDRLQRRIENTSEKAGSQEGNVCNSPRPE
ncbi:hypothetical protein GH714_014159 [Hevea brasiliensis]|uniref:Uncharacterized protein n=1 Tax=Hevea brasiliensis TaxID=3981 RepID=A0A6A6LNY8_HEVBR|nr:hypothetical protein GH714_014159 [Hevea brasiliensis]